MKVSSAQIKHNHQFGLNLWWVETQDGSFTPPEYQNFKILIFRWFEDPFKPPEHPSFRERLTSAQTYCEWAILSFNLGRISRSPQNSERRFESTQINREPWVPFTRTASPLTNNPPSPQSTNFTCTNSQEGNCFHSCHVPFYYPLWRLKETFEFFAR